MQHFCTAFDHRYAARGLALLHSLREHARPFRLWVLCLSEECYDLLSGLGLPDVEPVALAELERDDPELPAARAGRSRIEYYFTLSPAWPLWLLERHQGIGRVTYLDADLFFLGDPAPIWAEIGDCSIAMTEHRFPPRLAALRSHGRYNVGWLSFRGDARGLACLRWWRARCLEWCYDRVEGGRFADQGYLDRWPELFEGVHVISHAGANVAPWNLGGAPVRVVGGRAYAGEAPLIFYHVQGLRQPAPWLYDPHLALYREALTPPLAELVYAPYIRLLRRMERHGEGGAAQALDRPRLSSGDQLTIAKGLVLRRYLLVRHDRLGYLDRAYRFVDVGGLS